jgi:hypothetical protein
VLCSFATQKPVAAHGGAIGKILGVVEHVTAGEGDPWGEFANPANEVSSHFGIGNGQGGFADGAIEQYVDTANESWAQMAGNMSYLSVETEGEPTDPLTQNQVLSFARVLAWAHVEHGVALAIVDTPGEEGLITHGDGGVAWGNHEGCPGILRAGQRAEIVYLAALTVNPPNNPPATGGSVNMQIEDPITGGIWTIGADLHVEAEGGAPFLGGMNGNRFGWQGLGVLGGFSPRRDGNGAQGYDIAIALAKPNADGTWFDHYTFPRNESLVTPLDDPEADLAAAQAALTAARNSPPHPHLI